VEKLYLIPRRKEISYAW